jgi:CheY-like chemotaxis protein/Ran GTPase-activating protein (RanGAP) involved in mRNA processing and transport
MGFKAVKKFFWDKGMFQAADVHFRRRKVDGELIWLVASVASLIDRPVPGYVLKESCAEDEQKAAMINRLTRITALLAKAVDDAFSYSKNEDSNAVAAAPATTSATGSNASKDISSSSINELQSPNSMIPDIADDMKVLQTMLGSDTDSSNHLQNLLRVVGGNGNCNASGDNSGTGSDCEETKIEQESTGPLTKGCRSLNATPSVLETISTGPSAEISKINLTPEEAKLIALVLSGELSVQQLANLIFDKKNPAIDAGQILETCKVPLKSKYHLKKKSSFNDINSRSRSLSNNSNNNNNNIGAGSNFASSERLKQMASLRGTKSTSDLLNSPLHTNLEPALPPPVVSLNLSHSMMGNSGMVELSEALHSNTPKLKCLDISFCEVHERGFLSLCRALVKRRKKGYASLQGLILTGNTISYRSAKDLGLALCQKKERRKRLSFYVPDTPKEGYAEDDEYDEEEEDDDDDTPFGSLKRRTSGLVKQKSSKKEKVSHCASSTKTKEEDPGIQLLHLSATSLDASSLTQILVGLGEASRIREIDVSSNLFGVEGITLFTEFLEGRGQEVMPMLDRLNISNNNMGDDGLAKITRAISKRRRMGMVDIHLSFNDIGSGGTGTLMNKLLSQNVVTLSLDNNLLGDAGCQLVAASLTSMHHLSSLNLSFNQIGSRGITTLMRALIGCESLTFLGLSGNVMKIGGAIAMGFALAQHPRIAHLELYNCCLSQVAQCHIVTGIISNRWVPLQILNGFCVGPPMAAIGALDPVGQHLGNTECFTIRRNVQMKAILQWVQASKNKEKGAEKFQTTETNYKDFQSLDFVTPDESNNGAPSQSAFMRMLEWLNRIPFDEDELNSLRQYFYDADDGSPDGLRGSNGKINLKYRGDLLAALGSGMVQEIRDDEKRIKFPGGPEVGLSIDESNNSLADDSDWVQHEKPKELLPSSSSASLKRSGSSTSKQRLSDYKEGNLLSTNSNRSGSMNDSQSSLQSHLSRDSKSSKCKARITMFPKFFEKLDILKSDAQEMMNNELDPTRQDLIAQQFAEASLILLRQLRYQCMSSGLDGWRHGKIRRKVLIVDDSMVTRKLVGRAFEKANFIVDTAENGEVGVKMMKESVYDIAFMDIEMPVMNGFDATKALREWEDSNRPGARQPICALTATYVDDFEVHELMKFKEAGLDVMESKPCNIPRLFKVVDDVSPLFSDLSISVTKQLDSSSLQAG